MDGRRLLVQHHIRGIGSLLFFSLLSSSSLVFSLVVCWRDLDCGWSVGISQGCSPGAYICDAFLYWTLSFFPVVMSSPQRMTFPFLSPSFHHPSVYCHRHLRVPGLVYGVVQLHEGKQDPASCGERERERERERFLGLLESNSLEDHFPPLPST